MSANIGRDIYFDNFFSFFAMRNVCVFIRFCLIGHFIIIFNISFFYFLLSGYRPTICTMSIINKIIITMAPNGLRHWRHHGTIILTILLRID